MCSWLTPARQQLSGVGQTLSQRGQCDRLHGRGASERGGAAARDGGANRYVTRTVTISKPCSSL
jgi:hypothetical protein